MRIKHCAMQLSMSGFSHVNVAGGLVDDVDVVTTVVAPGVVVIEVDVVVLTVVVVGKIALAQDVQMRATLCRACAFNFPPHAGQLIPRLRRCFFWQPFSAFLRVFLHFRTQPRMIVQRPPVVVRHPLRSEIPAMQSLYAV
jgi:hypothetical protein